MKSRRNTHYDAITGEAPAARARRSPSDLTAAIADVDESRCRHTRRVEIVSVDPRDQSWEIDKPRYRLYFSDATTKSYEYEVSQADDLLR